MASIDIMMKQSERREIITFNLLPPHCSPFHNYAQAKPLRVNYVSIGPRQLLAASPSLIAERSLAMHPSPEITLDMTAEDLLKTLSNEVDDSCFEVDDISSVDPLADTHPVAKAAPKAASKPVKADALADDEDTIEFDSLEIELSASDMNAMLEVELPKQQAAEPAAPSPASKTDNG
jgi:hypothetical protein